MDGRSQESEVFSMKTLLLIIGSILAIAGCLGFVIGVFGGSLEITISSMILMILSVYLIAVIAQGETHV